MLWKAMFNEDMFREILLPSSDKVYNYVPHVHRKYLAFDWNNRTYPAVSENVVAVKLIKLIN